MFKVLIADDEPSVIESLIESVSWSDLGLEIVSTASSGKEAIEIIQRQRTDIVILDIRMPGINGLELCERIRKLSPDIQLIIISGYAEFSYAERAIRYGVLAYCLKPLEYEQITKTLVKAIKNLEKNLSIISAEEFLDALESDDNQAIDNNLGFFGLHAKAYYVAVSVGDTKICLPSKNAMVVELGKGQYGYISSVPVSQEYIDNFLGSELNLGMGYHGESVASGKILSTLHACTAMAYQFFVDPKRRFCTELEEQEANVFINQVQENIIRNKWDAVCGILKDIDENYRSCFNVRTSLKLCNIIFTGSLFREANTDYYVYELKQLVSEYKTLTNMLSQLRKLILVTKTAQVSDPPFTNKAFMKLMQYIGENYKKEISLASAAKALHMNPNYISQMFKKEAGITFIHYITQLRMEEAIHLLSVTNKPVIDIAMEVGYNDYFYFMRTFKKFTGKTPSKYRQEA